MLYLNILTVSGTCSTFELGGWQSYSDKSHRNALQTSERVCDFRPRLTLTPISEKKIDFVIVITELKLPTYDDESEAAALQHSN